MSFISVWEICQRLHRCIDLCQLINAVESVEHLALKNLKINSFREDSEVGKVQKEKKQLSYLVLLFIVTFILQEAVSKNICELLKWKALKIFFPITSPL